MKKKVRKTQNQKYDVVGSNPIIFSEGNGLYTVIYALPPAWKIEKKIGLTYEQLKALPYVTDFMLQFLK